MKKINLNGITAESVTGVLLLLVALINSVLQLVGINALPIENEEVAAIVSSIFIIVTTASQLAQSITDSLKNGEILEEDVRNLINKIRK